MTFSGGIAPLFEWFISFFEARPGYFIEELSDFSGGIAPIL